MPMPHRTFSQVAKRRLVGKVGSERVAAINALLGELPNYKNGPYADLRKWLEGELVETRVRAKATHRDSLQVRREGAAQIALVGAPNAGKSSLLQALSQIQIKTGDYAFTTLRPVPALTRIGGVPIQLLEIPGLIRGAAADRGGGRALLGVLRNADGIVFCQSAVASFEELRIVRAEVAAAGIDLPAVLAVTKADEAEATASPLVAPPVGDLVAHVVSVLDDASLDRLRAAIWGLTGLIRVYLRRGGELEEEPLAFRPGVTVADVADAIHHELGASCTGARVWGPSARFAGQRVGRAHVAVDGDTVEVLAR